MRFAHGVMRGDREHAAARCLELTEHTAQAIRLEPGVGIKEQEPFARGVARALMTGPGFAAPSSGKRLGVEDTGTVLAGNFSRAVGGGVIHDDDFTGTDGRGGERLKKSGKILLFVARGDDDGELVGGDE